MKYKVVLLRSNGRFVKESQPMSKYAAKLFYAKWDRKYDESYKIEIRPVS